MNIVILERDSVGTDVDVSCYEELGNVVSYANTATASEVRKRVANADIIIVNKAPMNAESLQDAPNLKLICTLATGYDNCDIGYCTQKGIKVANVRGYSTAMVAQHTVALALALSQKLPYYDQYVKSGAYGSQERFSHFSNPFYELDQKTWGIVGMGNIGQRVASIAQALGCRVIFYSITQKSTCTAYEQVDKNTLLAQSDILSLHCPLSSLSFHFIDANALRKMKPTAVLINVARGSVVNSADLCRALEENTIAAAGLDVLEKEPLDDANPLGKIKDSNRLIITPHLAWASVEARNRCVAGVYENIKAFLQGQARNIVNP